ncbi:MAG: sulfotransferase domain-containing protein [Candidatus Hodarchaeota archaeon]
MITLRAHARKLLQRQIDYLAFQKNFSINDTIAIFGSPRSGTTWLMELIETLPNYLTIFEPFNINWFPKVRMYDFGFRPYINPKKNDHKMYEYLNKVFSGRIRSIEPLYNLNINNVYDRIKSNKIIVKFIRANRIIPWISSKFKLKNIIYITRHPCATISSQIKSNITGYNILNPPKNIFPKKTELINEIKDIPEIVKIINKINKLNKIETLSIIWAIDQYIPFKYQNKYNFYTISYEDLLLRGEETLKNLFHYIGYDDYIYVRKLLKNPSKVTLKSERSIVKLRKKQLFKWKYDLSIRQIKQIINILEKFNIFVTEQNYEINSL